MRRSRVAEEAATSARLKLLRAIIEHDLFSSDSSDDDEEGGDERSRRDELGRFRRVGGYHPRPAQNPEGTGKEKWCHPYKAGKLWKLMHKETVLDDKSYWGKKWRRITGVPMKLFQDIVAEAACHDEFREKDLTDPKRGTAPVPLKLKIGGVCIWIRQGCTMEFAAEFAELDTETLRRFAKAYLLIFVQHEYPKFVHWPKRATSCAMSCNCMPSWASLGAQVLPTASLFESTASRAHCARTTRARSKWWCATST